MSRLDGNGPRDFTLTGGHRRRRPWRFVVWVALAVGVAGVVIDTPALAAVGVVVALAVSFHMNR